MTKLPEPSASPHYFVKMQQEYPVLNLAHRISRSDDHGIEHAHKAIQWLASQDLDHAEIANGKGFSKSDSKRDHALARWPTAIVVKSDILGPYAIKLARKYRRQPPPHLLVDPPAQKKLDI